MSRRVARTIDAVTRGALIPMVVAISACAVGKAPDPSSGQPGLVPTDCSHCAPGQNCLAGSGECYCDSNLCPGCCAADESPPR